MPHISSEVYQSTKEIDRNLLVPLPLPIVGEDKELSGVNGADGKWGTYTLDDMRWYPKNCIGKLVAGGENGRLLTSSASIVGRRLLMTAAHCVHAGGTGDPTCFPDIRFHPAHPVQGPWYNAKRVFLNPDWVTQGSWHCDVALVELDTPLPGQDRWGIRIAPEFEYGWTIFGYPAEPPFSGDQLIYEGGPPTTKPWRPGELIYELYAVDRIDMTPGASGGPWMLNGRPNIGEVIRPGIVTGSPSSRPYEIVGVNSHMRSHAMGMMVSPILSASRDLFREVLPSFPD